VKCHRRYYCVEECSFPTVKVLSQKTLSRTSDFAICQGRPGIGREGREI